MADERPDILENGKTPSNTSASVVELVDTRDLKSLDL